MKIFVTYAEGGEITSIGTPSERFADTFGVKASQGQDVTVFDLPGVLHPHHFEKYQREFRVEVQFGKPTLCKK